MIDEQLAKTLLAASRLSYSYGPTPSPGIEYQYVTEVSDPDTGFHAVVFKNSANAYIVAFTGTEPNFQDAHSDLNLGWTQWDRNHEAIFDLLRTAKLNDELTSVAFTGHSLGGVLAQYAAYEYAEEEDPASFTLTTFNALGGVQGLQQNLGTANYDSERLAGVEVNHFRAAGDMVSRLGEGHVGGNVRVIDFSAPDFIAAHRLETSFLNPTNAGYQLTTLPFATPNYLHVSTGQQLGAALGNLFSDGTYNEFEAALRTTGALLLVLQLAPTNEIDQVMDAMFPQYAQVDWGTVRSILPVSGGAVALGGAGLILAAGIYEGVQGATERLADVKTFLNQILGENFDSLNTLPTGQASLRMSVYLATTSGIGLASSTLGQALNGLTIDQTQLTTHLISGTDWLTDSMNYLRAQANAAGQNAANFSAQLVSGIYQEARALSGAATDFPVNTTAVLETFLLDTAHGLSNAVSEVLHDVPNTLFNLGRTLNFSDLNPFTMAYAQALDDPRLDSTLRTALEEAQAIVQQAGQTVVIQTGIGPNPFDMPGFVPGGASSATVEEKLGEVFRLSLPFGAGAGGQRVSLQFQGLQADQLSVVTDQGVQQVGANGTVQLFVPEGADQVRFTLRGSNEISSDATVTLSATLVDGNGDATHTTQLESTISVKAFVGNTDGGYEPWVEDYSDVTDPTISLPLGVGGFYHQTLRGGAGPDDVNYGAGYGDDMLYGNGGDDWIFGGYGHDRLYGGTGNDRLLADPYDYHPDPVAHPVDQPPPTLDGKDYADGGEGNDRIGGGGNDDRLIGGSGDDEIWGDALTRGTSIDNPDGSQTFVSLTGVLVPGDDVLEGGGGNDRLSGDGGDDILEGGIGDDLLVGDTQQGLELLLPMAPGDDYLAGGDGNDELQGNAGADVLLGGAGDDRLFGDDTGVDPSQEGDDWLEGGDGADFLAGRGGEDTLVGGHNADVLFADAGDDTLLGGEGDDIGFGGEGKDEIDAGAGADQFDGEAGDDVLFGDAGDDLLIGGEGEDELDGGADHDLLIGGADNDTLFGRDGNDELQGNEGSDVLVGDVGDDRLFGQEGDDELFGSEGDDALRGDVGDDLIDGGDGDDILVGDADGQIGGSGGNDTLAGGRGNDTLIGGGGQDTYLYEIGDGFDVIVEGGGEGNRLVFGAGIHSNTIVAAVGSNDSLLLRMGNGDHAVQIQNFGVSNLNGPHPIDTVEFADGSILTYDLLAANGLAVSGGLGNDQLSGTTQGERMFGGAGNDIIQGQEGADTLFGEDGADVLAGGSDEDVLSGGTGDDQLLGGEGSDTYRFNIGDGFDSLFDSGSGSETDTVVFGSGITSDSVSLSSQFGQIVIKVGSGSDGIQSGSPFDVVDSQTIERFQFADGTVLSFADLVAQGFNIDGTEFDDFLSGTELVDRFRGGLGNDRFEGGEGTDSYFFNPGDGVDTIIDSASAGAGNEVIFGPGIASDDLRFDLIPDQSDPNQSDLLIHVGTNGDAIQLDTFDQENVFGPHTVQAFRFDDSSMLTYEQLLARGFDLSGTDGDDRIAGTNVGDRIVSGPGADTVRGGLGEDTLDGGLGNDRLLGGQGNDMYVFGPGAGQDTIVEFQGRQDAIRFAVGVAPSDVVVTRNDNDLVLSLNGGADRLIVSLYFLAPALQVELVHFADGTIWDQSFIENLTRPVMTGTEGPDSLTGTSGHDRMLGLGGNDQLSGLSGNDLLDGGAEVDQLTGGMGDDEYIVDDVGDAVTELAGEGSDRVQSTVTRTLETNVENLTLTGSAAIHGTGNALDNILIGNSGANILTGGLGNDTYVIGVGDTVVESAGEGIDGVQTDASSTLGTNVENLTLTGSASLIGVANELDNQLKADGSISVLAGGDGNDTYVIGPNGDDDVLVETATGGIDTVIAGHDYRLPANIENLTLLDPRVPDFASFSLIPYGSSEQSVTAYGNNLANTLIGGRTNNVLDGGLGADRLIGGDGNDTYVVDHVGDMAIEEASEGVDNVQSIVSYSLSANVENLTLIGITPVNGTGNELNNELRGNEASNVLDGGAGDDALLGFGGADTYLFGLGSGRDTLFDLGLPGEIDTIQFDQTVAAEDVEIYRNGFNLELAISGTTDELTVLSFFGSPEYDQKQVRFSDGTLWNSAELSARALVGNVVTGSFESETLLGSEGHDVLIGSAGNDVLMGERGKDTLYGDATFQPLSGPQVIGDDRLLGGAGDDSLFDFRGDNLFDGGAGDDVLRLGTGEDNVLFGRGAGVDVVTLDNNRSDIDLIQMAADLVPSDVVLTWRSPSVADILIPDSGDRLTVQLSTDWFAVGPETTQAIVRFADGTQWDLAWSSSNVDIVAATSSDDVIEASFPATLSGLDGDDTYLLGSSGIPGNYEVIEAPGEGIDTVQSAHDYSLPANVENLVLSDLTAGNGVGNELDNLIVGNTGDNILDGGAGNDVLVGGIFRELEGPPYIEGTGSDILIGGEGDDILMEDAGNLSFVGGIPFLGGGLDRQDTVPREADDLLIGGTGNDTYIVHSQEQTVMESEDEGTDTVRSTVSYVLSEHLENLELISPPAMFNDEDNLIPPSSLNGTGNELDNVLIGSADANVLSGLTGRDTLVGGLGNDRLQGGAGHDTYLFNLGDGIDMIEDVATVGEGNRIQFAVGISRNDLTVTQDEVARTLTIQVGTSGTDRLVLSNFDLTGVSGSLVVETLAFADGSTASINSFFGPAITEGNDTITTGTGDDVINVLGGDDLVDAGAGNDIITGGTGNDTLTGGPGDDTYVYNIGDGVDTINDTSLPGATNTLEFGAGIDPTDLSLDLGSLLMRIGTSGDALHLSYFDPNNVLGPRTIETFRFADGTVLDYDQLVQHGFDLTGTGGNDSITGTNVVDRIMAFAGDDILAGGRGNDLLDGGAGTDTMYGGLGNDTYVADAIGDVVTELVDEGTDTVQTSLPSYTVGVNVENLTLTGMGPSMGIGNALSNQLTGNSEANLLDGKVGADTMAGGAGNDLYMVDQVGDVVTEATNEGFDTVLSSVTYSLGLNVEQLVLTGSAAINGIGNDLDNRLMGNSVANVLTGLSGNDTYVIGTGDTVVEAADNGTDTVVSSLTHTLAANVENLTLVGFNAINGTGNEQDNVLNGLLSLAGNTLTGGAGDDTYIIGSRDIVVEATGEGTDTVQTSTTHTIGANVENLTLTGADAINGTGNGLNNVLMGNSSGNVLTGAGGDDTLRGTAGNDRLNGGSGNDTYLLSRGDGQDLLQDKSGVTDKLLYDQGIDPLDLVISRQANDLRLAIHGSTDTATIQNWYTSTANRTETIQAGNGEILLSTQVDQLIQAMAGFTQQTGFTWDQAIDLQPQDVQAVLAASWQ